MVIFIKLVWCCLFYKTHPQHSHEASVTRKDADSTHLQAYRMSGMHAGSMVQRTSFCRVYNHTVGNTSYLGSLRLNRREESEEESQTENVL